MRYLLVLVMATVFGSVAAQVVMPADSLFTSLPEYRSWGKSMLIKGKDTVLVRTEPGIDYAIDEGTGIFATHAVTVVYKNGKKKKVKMADFSDLLVYIPGKTGNSITRYSSFTNSMASADLYRVLVDGKCQLLYHRFSGGGSVAVGINSYGSISTDVDRYYVYYKGNLVMLKADPDHANAQDMFMSFKKRCSIPGCLRAKNNGSNATRLNKKCGNGCSSYTRNNWRSSPPTPFSLVPSPTSLYHSSLLNNQ